jgi:hypothetical protein
MKMIFRIEGVPGGIRIEYLQNKRLVTSSAKFLRKETGEILGSLNRKTA